MSDFAREQRRSSELGRFLHAQAGDAMHLVGPGGRFLEVNDAACRLFGYAREEMLSLGVADVDSGFEPLRWQTHMASLQAHGLLRFESVGRHRDGSTFPIEITADLVEVEGEVLVRTVVKDLREQRHAEQRLRESEARFRELFEQASDGIMRTSLAGLILQANDALAQIVGLRHGRELVGTNVERLYAAPDTRREMLAEHASTDALRTRVLWRRRGGERIRVELQGRRERTSEGVTFTTFVRDVTDAHRREAILHALSVELGNPRSADLAGRLVERLVEVLEDDVRGVVVVRGRGTHRRVTHAWVEGRRVPAPSLEAEREAMASIEATLAHALGVFEGAHVSVWIRDTFGQAYGQLVALGLSSSRVLETTRSAMELFAQRLGAEMERAREEERFSAVFEHAPNAVLITTHDRVVTRANHPATELFGCSGDALVGTPTARWLVTRTVAGDEGESVSRLYAKRADGALVPVEINESFLRADDEELCVMAILDVSERVARDEARKSLDEELRRKQRLESLGTLAGGIAHDFNNLLGAILANAELAAASPEHAAQALGEIRVASARGRELVARILAFSRRQRSTRTVAALGPVLTEVERLVRATLPSGIEIVLELPDPSISARIDVSQIHQVVLNLVTNAWHAIAPAGGTIRISLDAIEAPTLEDGTSRPHARICVSDDGCGIAPELRERIFEPFFTTRAVGEGTGLGLSVAHGIVADHGGAIRLTSFPREGSTFEVLLPRAEPFVAAPARPVESRPAGPVRVLLVDDEWSLVRPLTRLLEREGFSIRAFGRPLEALGAFLEAPDAFDVVVSDVHMPELDGVQLVERMRAARPDMPAVLVSGNHDLTPADERPDVILLDKPFRPGELMDALSRALASRSAVTHTAPARRP